jgi:hypothetical protein
MLAALAVPIGVAAAPAQQATGTYRNSLDIQIPGDGKVESCADPTAIRGQQPGDNYWYMYCTKGMLRFLVSRSISVSIGGKDEFYEAEVCKRPPLVLVPRNIAW